jgi:hypothetical protein
LQLPSLGSLWSQRPAFESLEFFRTQAPRQSVRLFLEATSLEIEVVRLLESIVGLLGALSLLRSDCADRYLYSRLDCCSLAGGQPRERYYEYEEVKEFFGFVAELTRTATAIFSAEAKLSEEMPEGARKN